MRQILSALKIRRVPQYAFRYFAWILLVVLILLTMFGLYIYNISYQNFSNQMELTEQAVLQQAIDKIDNTLYFVNQVAMSTANNPDVVKTCIVPSLQNHERNFSVITTLKNAVEENVYIRKIYLYEQTQKSVMTSDSDVTTLASYVDSPIISRCLIDNTADILVQERNRFCSRLIRDGQKLYLVYDFIYSTQSPLGMLIFQIDKDAVFQSALNAEPLNNYDLSILENDGQSIWSTQESDLTGGGGREAVSSYTSWNYHLHSYNANRFSLANFVELFLPFYVLAFAVSIALTWMVSKRAYLPIKRLTQMVGSWDAPKQESTASSNEFEYLECAYQGLLSDNVAISGLVENARPELEQKLFSDIIDGVEYSCQELDEQLRIIGSRFRVQGNYQVFLLHFHNTENTDILLQHLLARQLQQLCLQTFKPAWGALQIVSVNDNSCILIAQFADALSAAQIKRVEKNYQAELAKKAAETSLAVDIVAGKVYTNLQDILLSHQDAMEQMHYRFLYQDEHAAMQQDSAPKAQSKTYFEAQLGQLRLSLDKGDIAIAQTQLAQLQQELFFGGLELHAVKEICEQMLDILIESARIYRGDDGIEEKPYAAFYQELRNATEKSELFALVQRDTEEILLVIRTESQKRQHRLIARAKKFIFNNYANCDLSINDIAHDVGCTSSYLSKIFTDYTGENLVSYMNSYRVNMAKELLMNSQLLIREVGASVGFNTVQNFNRVFKKVTDMTPNEYRKTYQKT